jgi:S1-C subfamily serine protease
MREPWPSVEADTAVKADGDRGKGKGKDKDKIKGQVQVQVQGVAEPGDSDPLDDQERRLAEAIGRARQSAVALEYATAEGPSEMRRVATGVVINDAGEVLSIRIDPPPSTAPLVAKDASGRRHPAEWVASDAETGITLLRIKPGVARPVRTAAHPPRLGGPVLVIGNPFGLGHSVLRGHIAGLNRRLELDPRQLGGLIQVAVALHPGDSGALVANLRGDWLGLIRSGLARPGPRPPRTGDRERDRERERDHDLGFAIPAGDALWVADQLRTQGRVDRAYLGVRIDPGAAVADPPGAVLLGVLSDSPADQAGLQGGDRIVTLNGHSIESSGDLTDELDRTLAGAEVTLDILRGSRTEHCTVRTVSRPPAPSKATSEPGPEPAPAPAPAPATPAAKADDLRQTLPREIIDRLDRLERRLDALEKRLGTAP